MPGTAPMIPGIVLAGGLSRRMGGREKALMRLGDETLLGHALARLRPQAGPLAINANGDPARLADFGLPVRPDSVAERPGPLAGILAGMDWAAELGHARVVTVAADTPFFPRDLVARLYDGAGTAPIVLAAAPDPQGILRLHPTFGLWPVALRAPLRAALATGTRRVGQWAMAQGATQAVFPHHGQDPFFNINTPEDLEAARAQLRLADNGDSARS